ncbi:hypothetical protein LSTR_LSTR002528 [Laodelphax striatellus]|uniref:Uncharacterized protein n=1 Tax=Laodelphax striatellus TaxID=195883 RepID=A0A482XKQ3_LAOST|nr:hypothetical protein LSTR_LSTR002528 [Laodelphax striatellus]
MNFDLNGGGFLSADMKLHSTSADVTPSNIRCCNLNFTQKRGIYSSKVCAKNCKKTFCVTATTSSTTATTTFTALLVRRNSVSSKTFLRCWKLFTVGSSENPILI